MTHHQNVLCNTYINKHHCPYMYVRVCACVCLLTEAICYMENLTPRSKKNHDTPLQRYQFWMFTFIHNCFVWLTFERFQHTSGSVIPVKYECHLTNFGDVFMRLRRLLANKWKTPLLPNQCRKPVGQCLSHLRLICRSRLVGSLLIKVLDHLGLCLYQRNKWSS